MARSSCSGIREGARTCPLARLGECFEGDADCDRAFMESGVQWAVAIHCKHGDIDLFLERCGSSSVLFSEPSNHV